MNQFWNERYNTADYVYGKNANEFLTEQLSRLQPGGRILFLAEGEGRNSVYAAKLGFEVDAVDFSEKAKIKALRLASENNVSINYTVQDLADYAPREDCYDAVVIINLHLENELREKVNANAVKALRIGGIVILQGFEKEQIKRNSGGPKDSELLYSLEDIVTDFQELEFLHLSKEVVNLSAGEAHKGEAVVVRFSGQKPSEAV